MEDIEILEGTWLNGKTHGRGKRKFKYYLLFLIIVVSTQLDGPVTVTEFKNGVMHGK